MIYSLSSPPGLITTFHLVSGGLACYSAIQTLIYACFGHRRRLYLCFSAMCAIVAAELIVKSHYLMAASVSSAATLLQWQFAFILAFMPALFSFVAIFTEQERFKAWLMLLTMTAAALIAVDFTITPYSLRYSTLEPAAPIEFPWGEVLTRYVGAVSYWNVLARAIFSALVGWAIVRSVILYRHGRHRSALFLVGALLFLLFASYLGFFVDLGYVQLIFPGGLGFLGLIFFLDAALALEAREKALALNETAENLRKQIALHQQAEERIRHMAYHDYVTGLPNRVKLQELLSDASARQAKTGKIGALILLNLDDFKTINEVLGHTCGDRLLQAVAHRLLALGQDGGMLAHLGSDDFVMLLPDVGYDQNKVAAFAQRIAERNAHALSEPFVLEGHSLTVSASAGIAFFPEEGENEHNLLQRADMALRRAKSYGRGVIQLYAANMRAEALERMQLERDMRQGLEHGEFEMYLQPQVDLAGGVAGAEALLRWKHPQRGWISPALFLPIAERNGMISQLGDWVLRQACQQINAWERDFPLFKGHLSVNVSPWQFMQSDYKECVRRQLDASGINPSRLTLEITESALLRDIDEAISTINFLKSHGLHFSLDDFGTGYASLSYLRRLPVDELKIDQAFVRHLGADARDTYLIETIINIGRCLGMRVVAEGVETESQKAALTVLGCWALQGYYFAPPMDKDAFMNWFSQYQGRQAPALTPPPPRRTDNIRVSHKLPQ